MNDYLHLRYIYKCINSACGHEFGVTFYKNTPPEVICKCSACGTAQIARARLPEASMVKPPLIGGIGLEMERHLDELETA